MLTLELREPGTATVPVEVFGTSPDILKSLSLDEVRRCKVFAGNRPVELGSLFEVQGDPASCQQVWRGDTRPISGIGYRMKAGWIRVESDCGNSLGARMTNGTIHVAGNSGHWTGSEMCGGLIHVRGNTGHEAGAAMSGSGTGQNGGTLLIEGNAGNAAGRMMRRGVLAIRGSAGNCCGYMMRAGTLVVCGKYGKNLAAEMVRGTVIVAGLDDNDSAIPDGFDCAGRHSLPVAGRLIRRHLSDCGFAVDWPDAMEVQIRHGDRINGSRGEIWFTRPEPSASCS